MTVHQPEAGGEVVSRFHLTPAVSSEQMLAHMRSAIARGLPQVTPCKAHDLTLSVAAGGPSLADTWQDLSGVVATVNGSLRFVLDRGAKPGLSYVCGVMDAGEHIVDLVVADPKVRYYVASVVHPKVFDKLLSAGCDVVLWHVTPESTADPEGVRGLLNEAYADEWLAIGGGCTMGLRWINLGFVLGFRKFKAHGLDSSFRDGSTHAYPDRADTKDRIEFCGRMTRPNFLAQVYDFFGVLNRFNRPDHERIEIELFGDGLLQDQYAEWLERQPPVELPMICCVKASTKYRAEYVTNLRDGVARHLKAPHRFVCFTDEPVDGVECFPLPADLPGWWAKMGLFKIRRPLIYFDLDVVITGDLTPLLEWPGFGIIRDWWQPGFNSSVMKLTGNEHRVWRAFHPDVMRQMYGDQDFITAQMPDAPTFPSHYFPSYKANRCQDAIPNEAMAIIFHGLPKPADCGGWVADHWKPKETA